MLRLTRTAIGLLTAQYRSVLRKCWAINVGVFSLMGKAATGVAGGVKDVVDSSVAALSQNDVMKSIPTAVVAATVALTALPTEAEALKWCIATSTSTTPLRLVADSTACDSGYAIFGTQSGDNSSALGRDAQATDSYSTAFGADSLASGRSSSAVGYYSNASGNYSTALGNFSVANEAGVVSVGRTPVPESVISQLWSQTTASGVYNLLGDYGYDYTAAIGVYYDAKYGVSHDEIIKRYKLDGYSKIVNVADGVNAHDAATVGQMNTALNNYYRKEDFDGGQVIDFTRYFKSGKLVLKSENLGVANEDFNQKTGGIVNNIANAFAVKAANATATMLPFGAPVVAGTSRHCLRQFSDVLAVFSQTVANINVVNDNFTVVTNTVAA